MKLYGYALSCNCDNLRFLLAHLGRTDQRRVAVDIFAGETLTNEYAHRDLTPRNRAEVV